MRHSCVKLLHWYMSARGNYNNIQYRCRLVRSHIYHVAMLFRRYFSFFNCLSLTYHKHGVDQHGFSQNLIKYLTGNVDIVNYCIFSRVLFNVIDTNMDEWCSQIIILKNIVTKLQLSIDIIIHSNNGLYIKIAYCLNNSNI